MATDNEAQGDTPLDFQTAARLYAGDPSDRFGPQFTVLDDGNMVEKISLVSPPILDLVREITQ